MAHGRLRAALSRHFTTVVAAGLAPRPVSLAALRALRPAFRQAISARHLPGLADRDAALSLALPEATFRVRLQSAYELLKCGPDADFSHAKAQYQSERDERG